MSTLRERQKEARRTQILDATRALVQASPDGPVTVERVAERAGVAPATVYNLIGRRDAVWAALGAAMLAEFDRRLAAHAEDDPLQRARAVVRICVTLFLEDPVVTRRVLSGWQQSGRLLARSPADALREALAAARDAGELRADADPGALAGIVACASTGALEQWAAGALSERRFAQLATGALDAVLVAATTGDDLPSTLRDRRR